MSNTVSSQLAPASDSESDAVEGGIVNDKEESDADSSEASEGSDQESGNFKDLTCGFKNTSKFGRYFPL